MSVTSFLKAVVADTKAVFAEILLGVSLMITGLATLFVGNYIIYSIVASLALPSGCAVDPGLRTAAMNTSCTNFNSTVTSLTGYTETILPIFGLCFLVGGFALILYTLRATGAQQTR